MTIEEKEQSVYTQTHKTPSRAVRIMYLQLFCVTEYFFPLICLFYFCSFALSLSPSLSGRVGVDRKEKICREEENSGRISSKSKQRKSVESHQYAQGEEEFT